jgi:hypothetical protein
MASGWSSATRSGRARRVRLPLARVGALRRAPRSRGRCRWRATTARPLAAEVGSPGLTDLVSQPQEVVVCREHLRSRLFELDPIGLCRRFKKSNPSHYALSRVTLKGEADRYGRVQAIATRAGWSSVSARPLREGVGDGGGQGDILDILHREWYLSTIWQSGQWGVSQVNPLSAREAVTAQRCPVCRAKIVERVSGQVLIRNAILRVDAPSGRVSAKCSRCKSWVEVPLRFVG